MPKKWFYPTAFSTWGDEERQAIERVIDSGQFTQGPEVEAFEAEFAAFHGKRHAIMVNSGSSANLIAVAALFHVSEAPLKRGDKAIVPALAWSTTYAPLVQHGLDLVLMDCDSTWNADVFGRGFDPDAAKLVVGCSVLGNPADLAGLGLLAQKTGAHFIEDNCESLGAAFAGGKLCGTFGKMSTASLFYSHQISAIEGGVILTDDKECNALCRVLRAHGWTRDVIPPTSFEKEYDFVAFGYNVRGLEMHAAIARAQLMKLPEMIKRRRANASLFARIAAEHDLPINIPAPIGTPSPFGIQFRMKDQEAREAAVIVLRQAGIDCRLPTGGSFRLHEYGEPWAAQETPVADDIHRTGLFIGNGAIDLSAQITRATDTLRGAFA